MAVKEVSLSAGLTSRDRAERLRRTLREARTAATLRGHPGIVTVYDVVEEDGLPWIIMELVEGPSMAQVIRAEQRLPEDRVARIGLQVISALAAAEAAGVVHRDVKPANILLTDGRAAELEFGFAHRDAPGVRFRFYARCVIRDSGDTGILWFFAPAEDWAEASTHIDTFVETFRLD
ncbi:protein kinase domain-containing protein [Streptosporangium canum]|uniref:protein kinase domain-containing protein n=1 Tax=Streptosporangium canum TaxID=324952 RepID=UPI0033BD4059